ncbi:MAG: D-ribose pyranase [Firmicutes bacterium]|nr:D-ribose pyranase [Bacillota bacterium]
MKKTGVMNKDISSVIAGMGHNDKIMICGSAFPIPSSTCRIDLALEPGLPAFLDVLRVVLKELKVEQIMIAKETLESSPKRFQEMVEVFPGIEPKVIPQAELKEISKEVKACIRTGECTPFSNIILVSGVIF